MRLDKYLKVSRIIKRRTVANEACDSGRVMLNDKVARASAEVKAGDVIEIAFGNKSVKVRVTSVQESIRKEDANIYKIVLPEQLAVLKICVIVRGKCNGFADLCRNCKDCGSL